MRYVSVLCGMAVLLSLAASLPGQTFGEITGEVRDPSGSIIAGADVKVVSKATGAERTTVTNNAGLYSFPALQPGLYDVTATRQGFQSVTRTDLELQIQQTARVDFALQIGQSTQVVEVTAGAPLLTTENSSLGAVIENRRIVDLPLNGRNFLALVALTPNVSTGFGTSSTAVNTLGSDRAQQNISVSGARSEFNHFTLDGVENTDPTFNTYIFLPSIDALQEFKVQSGIYPAEFGRGVGQVNVSTKSGTNSFHGTVFEFLRNDKVDAADYAFVKAAPKNPLKWNQYGYTFGGPVWIPKVFNGKNRLFFLSNWEGYRDRRALQSIFSVPTAPLRAGDFTGLPTIYDPTTRVQTANGITAIPFQGNKIPLNRMSSPALKLLEFIPVPNVNVAGFNSNRQDSLPRVLDKDQFNERIDFVESAKSNWYGRFSWGTEGQTQAGIGGTGNRVSTQPSQQMISNTRIFTPTMVNEFRATHVGFANSVTTLLGGVRNIPAELNIPGFAPPLSSEWGVPTLQINTFGSTSGGNNFFGDVSAGPFVNNDHFFQFVDNISWSKGKHSLRFGAEVRRDRYNTVGAAGARGMYAIDGTATENPALPIGNSAGSGTGMADFLLGYTRSATLSQGLGFAQFRATTQNYYIDDSWRIHPKVTISLGLRYENVPPYYDKSQRWTNIALSLQPPAGVANVADRSLHPTMVRLGQGDFYEGIPFRYDPAINVARDGRLGDRGIYADNNDFAPRLGIAWSPSDKWTIRAGAGVFYVQDISSFYLDSVRANTGGSRISTTNVSFPNVTFNTAFVNPLVSTPKILGIQVNRRTPYSLQYSFNVQRQLTKDTVLEVGYLGSEAHKLMSWQPFNEPLPSTSGNPQARAPFPELSVQGWVMAGTGNSNYHSLAARLQRRFAQGFSLMGSYTWSKSIDLSSGARNHDGEQQFPQNAYCLQCERGLSNFNVAHRFVTSGLYELPFGKGKTLLNRGGVVNAVAGGWQLSSILALQTGTPNDITSGSDAGNRGYNTIIDRPNSTGLNAALSGGSANRFFDKNQFLRVPAGTLGNVGRNTMIGPGLINWDASLFKTFVIREQQQLQFRFESFNVANHPNLGLPNVVLSSAAFGTIRTTSTNMRNIQFGLKYIF